ncbi:unnamed protein product [Microthlaspi erraticum]|uniref:Uncharacterized protein n=1 Tax=Microthlaspi erraticum TaxID=1685480 RepID=A0A6D2HS76_9BRAS|nr:unnamed protein product [Microthlaspi erraticum]
MQIQTRPVLLVVVVVMVVMSCFMVEGGGRGIYGKEKWLHYDHKGEFVTSSEKTETMTTTSGYSARGVDNHHNIPRQNYGNWAGNGGDGGGDDGTG